MSNLTEQLKNQVIEQLNLEEVSPDDIDPQDSLFGDGLGLDSIDALELIVLLDKEYGIKITDPEEGKEVFHSINTMVQYIEKHR